MRSPKTTILVLLASAVPSLGCIDFVEAQINFCNHARVDRRAEDSFEVCRELNGTSDEDVNGLRWQPETNHPGSMVWIRTYAGDTNSQAIPTAAAALSGGEVYVTGTFTGASRVGPGPIGSAGDADIFLARYDSSGAARWSIGLGSPLDDAPAAVEVTPEGDALLIGNFTAPLRGVGTVASLAPIGQQDAFLAKVGDSGLMESLFQLAGDPLTRVRVRALTHDVDGNVFVTGTLAGALTVDGAVRATRDPAGPPQPFVLGLDRDLHFRWVLAANDCLSGSVSGVGVIPQSQSLMVAGHSLGVGCSLNGIPLTFDPGTGGGVQFSYRYLARIDFGSGTPTVAWRLVPSFNQAADLVEPLLAVDPSGASVLLVKTQFGSGTSLAESAFLYKYSADGSSAWPVNYMIPTSASVSSQSVAQMAVGPDGNIRLTGSQQAHSFSGFTDVVTHQAFFSEYPGAGWGSTTYEAKATWTRTLRSSFALTGRAFAFDPDGNATAVGQAAGEFSVVSNDKVDRRDRKVVGSATNNLFLLRFYP